LDSIYCNNAAAAAAAAAADDDDDDDERHTRRRQAKTTMMMIKGQIQTQESQDRRRITLRGEGGREERRGG
jgi:hypothetical protein